LDLDVLTSNYETGTGTSYGRRSAPSAFFIGVCKMNPEGCEPYQVVSCVYL